MSDQRARYDTCHGQKITSSKHRMMTWRDRAKQFRTSWQDTTPAVATKSTLFFSSSAVCPRLAAPLLSVDFLVFLSHLFPSCRRPATMLPASFASNFDLSTPLGMEGLRRNIAAIRSTPPPPAVGYSLGYASVLVQGMGEGLSSKYAGQARDKWFVILLCLLIVANDHRLLGGVGGMPLPYHTQISFDVTIERERGISYGINKFKLTTMG